MWFFCVFLLWGFGFGVEGVVQCVGGIVVCVFDGWYEVFDFEEVVNYVFVQFQFDWYFCCVQFVGVVDVGIVDWVEVCYGNLCGVYVGDVCVVVIGIQWGEMLIVVVGVGVQVL